MASNTTVQKTKLIIRRGTDVDRRSVVLSDGEPGFTIDTNRVFIGDALTAGGICTNAGIFSINDTTSFPVNTASDTLPRDLVFQGGVGYRKRDDNTGFEPVTLSPDNVTLLASSDLTISVIDVPEHVAPIGMIVGWPSDTIPDEWLLCDGAVYSTDTYTRLYSKIGTAYGGIAGETFNVPDLRHSTIIGKDLSNPSYNTLGVRHTVDDSTGVLQSLTLNWIIKSGPLSAEPMSIIVTPGASPIIIVPTPTPILISPSPTPSPVPPLESPVPTASPIPPTPTPSPIPPTPSVTPGLTPTPTPTSSGTPTPTPTNTPTPTPTPTPSPTRGLTPTPTPTSTPTPTPSHTPAGSPPPPPTPTASPVVTGLYHLGIKLTEGLGTLVVSGGGYFAPGTLVPVDWTVNLGYGFKQWIIGYGASIFLQDPSPTGNERFFTARNHIIMPAYDTELSYQRQWTGPIFPWNGGIYDMIVRSISAGPISFIYTNELDQIVTFSDASSVVGKEYRKNMKMAYVMNGCVLAGYYNITPVFNLWKTSFPTALASDADRARRCVKINKAHALKSYVYSMDSSGAYDMFLFQRADQVATMPWAYVDETWEEVKGSTVWKTTLPTIPVWHKPNYQFTNYTFDAGSKKFTFTAKVNDSDFDASYPADLYEIYNVTQSKWLYLNTGANHKTNPTLSYYVGYGGTWSGLELTLATTVADKYNPGDVLRLSGNRQFIPSQAKYIPQTESFDCPDEWRIPIVIADPYYRTNALPTDAAYIVYTVGEIQALEAWGALATGRAMYMTAAEFITVVKYP